MARTLTRKSYPLLKVLLPLALLVLAVGLVLFFTHEKDCASVPLDNNVNPEPGCAHGEATFHDQPTLMLLPYVIAAALVALGSLLYRKREEYTLVFPTDQLHGKSRQDLQKVLDGLEEARAKGDITQDRYAKARDRVLAEMNRAKAAK